MHPDVVSVHITAHPPARNSGMKEMVPWGALGALGVDGKVLVEIIFEIVLRYSRKPVEGPEVVSMQGSVLFVERAHPYAGSVHRAPLVRELGSFKADHLDCFHGKWFPARAGGARARRRHQDQASC